VPPAGGGPGRLDTGQALSYAWARFTDNIGAFMLLVVAVFVATVVASLIAFLVIVPGLATESALLTVVGLGVGMAVVIGVTFMVQAGVYRAGLGVTRGERPSASMLTDTTNLGPYLLTILVVALGALVGFALCVLPGIIWLFFTAYAPLLALDKGQGPGESIKNSIDMIKENLGEVFVVLLVAYVIYYIGGAVCALGLLVSIPVALVMITYSYRVLQGEQVVGGA